MYAVGLGAAILTQFRQPDGSVVRVLADGGMGHGGYLAEGVLQRLPEAWDAFAGADDSRRLDLIIGTHYDGDHLKGLIPIAEDHSVEIGEVWLPPVKDDTDDIPGHTSESDDYLAVKFFDDEDDRELMRYLDAQREQVEDLQRTEIRIVNSIQEQERPATGARGLPRYRYSVARERLEAASAHREPPTELKGYLSYFERQEADAAAVTGSRPAHESATYDSSVADVRDLARNEVRPYAVARALEMLEDGRLRHFDAARLRIMPAALASIRKSTAAKAITAIHLHGLVRALRGRREPVRPKCHYISAGQPRRFAWDATRKRFVPRSRGGSPNVVLTLLGPSDTLVEKHRDKLPVGAYLYALDNARGPIRLESITESNQLSYILTLETADQRLLISGDAGCYGFTDDSSEYFPRLLKALSPLHVVQVAHHAGRNYDFYNTLLEAGFAEQTEPAWLLLSHEVRDESRPSDAFSRFVAEIRREGGEVSLLFTSVPTADKVAGYDELIAPVAPGGSAAEKGDVRLSFVSETGESGWVVEKHAVEV